MANTKYTGNLTVASSDYKYIKWAGRTKDGHAVTIELNPAISKSNIDFTIAEKDDIVPEVEFEGVYTDEALTAAAEAGTKPAEPWTITLADGATAGAGEIVLGAGKFYIGTSSGDAQCVGLTRGGGSFVVERTFREINADDDPGAVEGRIDLTESRAKLKVKVLQFITKLDTFYTGVTKVSE